MKRKSYDSQLHNLTLFFCGLFLVAVGVAAQKPVKSPLQTSDLQRKASQIYGGLPLIFEKNVGQASPEALYLSRTPAYTLFLTERDAVLVNNGGKKQPSELRMRWLGSNEKPSISGEEQIAGKTNYLIGKDSSKWHTGVANYTRVTYDAVYPGINLAYYGNQQRIEYDLTVAPGADPHIIQLQFQGANRLRLDKQTGDLMIRSGGVETRFHKPIAYQKDGEQYRPVSGSYVLSTRNTVSFSLGAYDHSKPLVIDPYVVYSTMFGGSPASSLVAQVFYGMAVDGQGDVYLQGIASVTNLPTTAGSFQPACNLYLGTQCSNFFVAKFDPTKSGAASLVYATYIGGNEEKVSIYDPSGAYYQMNDIAADSAGDAYFAGTSSVANYPTTANAYNPSCVSVSTQPCYGAGVLTKLNPTGSALLYSTYIPATYDGDAVYPGGVTIDSSQVVYMGGGSGQDLPSTDGSTCSGCYQSPFVAAIDTTKSGAASLLYAEYVPLDDLTAIAADSTGNMYLGGLHYPTTLTWPGTIMTIPLNGFQTSTTNTAGIGPYFVRLNHSGVATYSTYIGSGTTFGITAVTTDPNGIAYAGGDISGPVTQLNGLTSTSSYSGYDGFIAKIDTTQINAASLLYATYLTGNVSYGVSLYGLAANGTGQVAFSGDTTLTTTFPEVNPLTQPVATPAYAGADGAFMGVLDTTKSGTSALTTLSLLDGVQLAESIAYDPSNNLIIGGFGVAEATADPFLSVPASYQTSVGNEVNPPFFYKISLASTSSLSVSPSMLTFNSQVENTTSTSQPVTVKNSGSTAVTFTSIVASSQFGETDNCLPSLAANSSCTVNVTFTPTAVGTPTGTLTLTDSDSSSPQSVALNGTGIAGTPLATLSPALPFGNQTINVASSGMVATLSNSGTATLTNIVISITGANPTDFAETNNCGTTLNTGPGCSINVVFDPSVTGALSATLSVADNAASSPQAVALTGTGTAVPAPVAVLTPSALPFSATNVGVTTSAQIATLSNAGNAPLTITSVTIIGLNPTDFAVTTTCGATLAAGFSCPINVTFKPAAVGSFSATVNVVDNASGSPQTVGLTGTGTAVPAPVAVLSPAALPFSPTTVGVTTSAQSVTLSNTGNASLTITSLGITGTNPTDFAETTTCGATLAAGFSCPISVTFTPAAAGSLSAAISVVDNASGSPQTTTLSGTGVAPTDFTTSSPTPPETVVPGGAAQFTIAVQPSSGTYSNVVTLSATGLPNGATASFVPASVTPGSAGATSIMTIQTVARTASGSLPQRWPWAPSGVALVLVAPIFWRRFRKGGRRPRFGLFLGAVLFVLLGAGSAFISGCGAGFALPPQSTTYTITVTGTSGADTHSTTVSLTVQ